MSGTTGTATALPGGVTWNHPLPEAPYGARTSARYRSIKFTCKV